MQANSPQNNPDSPLTRINALLPDAMATLVSPPKNEQIAGEIVQLLEAILRQNPSGPGQRIDLIHAGLRMLADDLDTAHQICQDIPTSLGSAWHAVMHRREGDFSNSKYWWRRASDLSWRMPDNTTLHLHLHAQLSKVPPQLAKWRDSLQSGYDPAYFVDLVEEHYNDRAISPVLVTVQRAEWQSLFHQSFALRNA
jgi:hypothetical protein